jgi:hypothetical protein
MGNQLKSIIKELSQAWVVGLNLLVKWEEGIDGLSSCIQVFSLQILGSKASQILFLLVVSSLWLLG